MSSVVSFLPGGLLVPALAAFGTVIYAISRWSKGAEKNKVRLAPGINRDRQAIEMEDEPGVYRSGLLVNQKEPTSKFYEEVDTLYDAFKHGLEASSSGDCLGYRPSDKQPYHFISYGDVFRAARDFGSVLTGPFGVKHGNDSFVGIYAKNSPEWMMTALACIQQSIVVVPLYDTLGAEAAAYIVNQTEIQVVVTDSIKKAESLLNQKKNLPTLRHIVVIEAADFSAELHKQAEDLGVKLHTFKDVIADGRRNPMEMHPPKADDLYIICYTSGTTGLPKGVMLTHRNLISNVSAFLVMLEKTLPQQLADHQTLISYLPLSHMMEQVLHWYFLLTGSRIGYFRGNILGLTDDVKALKPTVYPVVPRLLKRIYDGIQYRMAEAGTVKKWLFQTAYQAKVADLRRGIVRNDTIWDKLVFRKLQQEIGGQVQFMVTGSAPISAEVLESCRVMLGATILEGYGQTETTALGTSTWPGDNNGGHVGGPASCTLIKLADVEELQCYAKDKKGEICIKGPSITKGYYKDPVKTAELIDEDGWLHTGDVGQMLPNGTFKIIDRKKHIFKLAQGEYVAPEKIENVYVRASIVAQVFVDGSSLQPHLVAIVVPNGKELSKWYKANVHDNGANFEDICKSKQARDYVLAEIVKIGKENKLNSIEQVKAVHLSSELFTIENDLLTPTLKAKRPQLRKYFAATIDELYEEGK